MNRCPYCYGDPIENLSHDCLYKMGAYCIDERSEIECVQCEKKIIIRPFESIDYDFEEPTVDSTITPD